MKLYVWSNPYSVAYGSSLVFAIASNLREAKRIAATAQAYSHGDCEQATPKVKIGKPTRVLSVPCGEWHEWAE